MATLSYKKKKSFKPSVYGIPAEKKYPMPDKEHAINAKARAKQEFDAGKLSRALLLKIQRKANRIIKKEGGTVTAPTTLTSYEMKKKERMKNEKRLMTRKP